MGWGCGEGRTDVALESARRDFQPHAGLQLEGRGGVSLSVVVVGEEGGGGGLAYQSHLVSVRPLRAWEDGRRTAAAVRMTPRRCMAMMGYD